MSISPLPRPGSVTIVVVLTWINAILHLLFGVLLLVAAVAFGAAATGSTRVVAPALLIVIGIVYLIIGLITAFVATRLGQGGRGSRMLLTVIEVISIVANVITWISVGTRQQGVSSALAIAVAAVILVLLWNKAASRFFEATA